MENSDIVNRLNRDRLMKVMYFNSLPPHAQATLAGNKDFWQSHSCPTYSIAGRCLACGSRRISVKEDAYRQLSLLP